MHLFHDHLHNALLFTNSTFIQRNTHQPAKKTMDLSEVADV